MRQKFSMLLTISFLFLVSCDFSNSDKKTQTNDNAPVKIDINALLEVERQDYEKYKNLVDSDKLNEPKEYMYERYNRAMIEDKMLKKYSDLIKKQPDNPKGYFQLANIEEFGDEAVNNYRKAIKLYLQNKMSMDDIEKEDFIKTMGADKIYFSKSDLDNDSKPEILIANLDGISNWVSFIIDKKSNEWKIIDFEVDGEFFRNIYVVDLNKNGISDIIFEHMGGAMGVVGFKIYEYDKGRVRELGSDAVDDHAHRYGDIKIEDIDSDGLKEIIFSFYGNTEELPLPSKWIEYYKWDGKKYSLFKELREQ